MLRKLIFAAATISVLAAGHAAADAQFRMKMDVPLLLGTGSPVVEDLAASLSVPFPETVLAGTSFDSVLAITGGKPPYRVEIVGTRPEGVNLSVGYDRISGNFLQSSNAFIVKVLDDANAEFPIAVGAVNVVSPLVVAKSVAQPQVTGADSMRIDFPAVQGGMGSPLRAVEGTLPAGASWNETTGSLIFQNVAAGTHGPFVFKVSDGFDQVDRSDPFTVTVISKPSMKMTLPGSRSFTFVGWTAKPSFVTSYDLYPTLGLYIRVSCASGGTGSLIIPVSTPTTQLFPHANGSTSCHGGQGWATWWPTRINQPLPIPVVDIVPGALNLNPATFTAAQATWTNGPARLEFVVSQ